MKEKGMKTKKNKIFTKKDYGSGDGFVTTTWGPAIWHFLHTMSFNYPVNPSENDKTHYRDFILSLQYILPCGKCRENLKNNLGLLPLTMEHMKSRDSFSKYIYKLHETVNKMLGKKSNLSYCAVRDMYEHFRSRCTLDTLPEKPKKSKTLKRESGCTEPLYGKKSKCVIKIVPIEEKIKTFSVDEQCKKHK